MHPDLSSHPSNVTSDAAVVAHGLPMSAIFFSSESTHHSYSRVLRHLISVGKYGMIGSWMCETSVVGLAVSSWVGTGKER